MAQIGEEQEVWEIEFVPELPDIPISEPEKEPVPVFEPAEA
jgi:hypothetical protein